MDPGSRAARGKAHQDTHRAETPDRDRVIRPHVRARKGSIQPPTGAGMARLYAFWRRRQAKRSEPGRQSRGRDQCQVKINAGRRSPDRPAAVRSGLRCKMYGAKAAPAQPGQTLQVRQRQFFSMAGVALDTAVVSQLDWPHCSGRTAGQSPPPRGALRSCPQLDMAHRASGLQVP